MLRRRSPRRGSGTAASKRFIVPPTPSRAYGVEPLESRTLLTIAEPNDSTGQAYFDQNNIYGATSFVDTGSVNNTTDRNDYVGFYNLYGPSKARIALNGIASGADIDLYVHDQNGAVIASSTKSGNLSEDLVVDLPGNQYFYVRAFGFTGSSNYGLYVYNDYAGATLATARDIGTSWGQTNSKFQPYGGGIFNADYLDFFDNVDIYKFKTETVGTISLRRLNSDTGTLTTTMQLLDSNGSLLATGFADGTGYSLPNYTAPAGTYYVKLTHTGGSGNYSLRIVTDYAGNSTASARELGNITNTSRRITEMVSGFGGTSYDDALDLYKFSLSQSATAWINLDIDTSFFNPPTFDANFFVGRDTNGNGVIDSGEQTYTSSNAGDDALQLALTSGTWYVGVTQNGAYTTYDLDLDVDLDQANNPQPAFKNMSRANQLGTLTGYTQIDGGFGRINGSSDFTDFYKFTMSTNGRISAFANNVDFYSRSLNDPYITIIKDANNNQTYDNGEAVVIATNSQLSKYSLAAGTYYLLFSNDGQQAAYYGTVIPDYAGNTLGTARNLGSFSGNASKTVNDYIEQNFDSTSDPDDYFKFTTTTTLVGIFKTDGVSGEDLSLTLIKDNNGNGAIDSGDTLHTANISNQPDERIRRWLAAGTYFLRVHGINGATDYSLFTQFQANPFDGDNTINEVKNLASNKKSIGQSYDGSLDRLADVDLVQFTASAGQKVGFDVDGLNGSTGVDSYLRLFNSAGTQLASNNNGAAPGESVGSHAYLAYTFPSAGTYYIGVSMNPNIGYSANTGNNATSGSGQTGDYRLFLNNLGTSLPTTIRINAAGNAYTVPDGRTFAAPSGFNGSSIIKTDAFAVAGTTADYLYYTRRYGNFTFSKGVANGTYTLRLFFVEDAKTAANQRKFDVFAEGGQILNDYDIYADRGYRYGYSKTFTVNVSDQKIDLSFVGVLGNAVVSAIEAVKV
jgi:hypothetical protein